jgi:serine/threonine protein kinase
MSAEAKPETTSRGQLADGEVVGQRYRVSELIGSGGQSRVYRAVDLRDGDEVALKVLKASAVQTDPDAVERMFREAYAMATLHGTAALRVLGQTWTDTGSFCLVTELVRGHELGDWLDQREARGERVEVDALVELLEPIVFTLDAAHSQGIVHRDLKPSNIFVIDSQYGGGVRLMDFGFAKFTRMRGFTQQHVIAGSPSYIAPEAWQNKRDLFDQRLDVYSMGAVIFRCLAKRPPFEGPNVLALLQAVTQAPRPSLTALRPDLPSELDEWVQYALAIDPEERFQRVGALWRAFRSAAGLASLP